MKKVILVLASMMMAAPAMASKARVSALQGATFLVDTQTIFENPAHILSNGQLLTLEMGAVSNSAATRAEGGIFRKETEMTYGVYLGHVNDSFRATNGFLVQQNPVEVFFGKNNWGASVSLSNSDKKTTEEKETTLLGRFGMVQDDLEFYGTLEVLNNAEKVDDTYKSGPNLNVGVEKNAGRFYYGAELAYGMLKEEVATVETETKAMGLELSVMDRSLKTATRELYYGVLLQYAELKIEDAKQTTMMLPVVIGLEVDAASWLTFRGSVKQNFLLGSTKDETAAAPGDEADSIAHDTTVAVGTGIKWGDFMLDGTLAGSTTGQLNGNQVLTNASVTYKF